MLQNRKLTLAEVVVLTLPLILLAWWGVSLLTVDNRDGHRASSVRPDSAFQLIVTEVTFKREAASNSHRVTVFVNYQGSPPIWWGEPRSIWLQHPRLVSASGKEREITPYAELGLTYNPQRQQYVLGYFFKRDQWRMIDGQTQFKATIATMDTFTRFLIPVRKE